MDIKTYSDQLQKKINDQIEAIRLNEEHEARAAAVMVEATREALFQLKQFIHTYQFKDKDEEILFFKEIKPALLSRHLYYSNLLPMLIQEQVTENGGMRKHYRKALKHIRKSIRRDDGFYRYWICKSTHMDDRYFTRQETAGKDPNIDWEFSTIYDIKLASIMANEELIKYFVRKWAGDAKEGEQRPRLKWTGTKTALTELIYALQTAGVFNNATADVKQIAACFERSFAIELGNFYDTFQDIRMRKKNTTKFIDQMKEGLVSRVDSADGL